MSLVFLPFEVAELHGLPVVDVACANGSCEKQSSLESGNSAASAVPAEDSPRVFPDGLKRLTPPKRLQPPQSLPSSPLSMSSSPRAPSSGFGSGRWRVMSVGVREEVRYLSLQNREQPS